jgi:glycosyltransferase involved in cell wall biosynthesis
VTLNAQATLADAIRSMLVQTCDDWKLLLVDDGSSDESVQRGFGWCFTEKK